MWIFSNKTVYGHAKQGFRLLYKFYSCNCFKRGAKWFTFNSPAIVLEYEDHLAKVLKELQDPVKRNYIIDKGYKYLSNL